jgi:hypothetical protein
MLYSSTVSQRQALNPPPGTTSERVILHTNKHRESTTLHFDSRPFSGNTSPVLANRRIVEHHTAPSRGLSARSTFGESYPSHDRAIRNHASARCHWDLGGIVNPRKQFKTKTHCQIPSSLSHSMGSQISDIIHSCPRERRRGVQSRSLSDL